MRADLIAACRSLIASKSFTAIAVVVLALGIGLTTAIYSVVDAVLLRRLPYSESERLVEIREGHQSIEADSFRPVAPQDFLDWDAAQDVFDSLAAIATSQVSIAALGSEPEDLSLRRVTADFFDTLRFSAALGRTFGPEHEVEGRDRVIVLSHAFWQHRFGGDTSAVGRTVALNGVSYDILGVLPPDAVYPAGSTRSAGAYVPLVFTPSERVRVGSGRAFYLSTVARLKPGVTLTTAQAQMDQIAATLRAAHPVWNEGHRARIRSLQEAAVGDNWRSWLWLLLAVAAVVLAIACVNVALLQLSRAVSREHEISVRASLGAGRWRLIRQLLVEHLVLALLGAILGSLVAVVSVDAFKATLPGGMPRLGEVRIDERVLGMATVIATLAGLAAGIVPALVLSNAPVARGLSTGIRLLAGGARRPMLSMLVVVEIASTVVLLVAAALFVRTFAAAAAILPGFETARLLTATLAPLPGPGLLRVGAAEAIVTRSPRTGEARGLPQQDIQALIDRLSGTPGIAAAAFAQPGLPLGGSSMGMGIEIRGRVVPADAYVAFRRVTAGYHAALGIPLLAGRHLAPTDAAHATPALVVNAAAVRAFFAGASPLGAVVIFDETEHEIVGVVGDVRQRLEEPVEPEVNVLVGAGLAGGRPPSGQLAVRMSGDPNVAIQLVKRAAAEVMPTRPLRTITTMDQLIAQETVWRRFDMWMISGFAMCGLLIAAVGVYGMLAFGVERRTREIGVRMALGATPAAVARLVFSETGLLLGCGVVAGATAAAWLSSLFERYLYGVGPRDATAFVVAAAVMSVAALAAAVMPVKRAVRVEPVVALRAE